MYSHENFHCKVFLNDRRDLKHILSDLYVFIFFWGFLFIFCVTTVECGKRLKRLSELMTGYLSGMLLNTIPLFPEISDR